MYPSTRGQGLEQVQRLQTTQTMLLSSINLQQPEPSVQISRRQSSGLARLGSGSLALPDWRPVEHPHMEGTPAGTTAVGQHAGAEPEEMYGHALAEKVHHMAPN